MSPSFADTRHPGPALPEPDGPARARSERLAARLRDEIAGAGGAIPFSTFMDRVLYTPGLGYYGADDARIGETGDFVTAPELSELFSRCVARHVETVLARLGGGDVLEAGAGTGAMAAEILATLAARDSLPERYLVLERSAALRARQRETIAARGLGLVDRVHWIDGWPAPGFEGAIIANELLDALPVTRFAIAEREPFELHVECVGEGFGWRRAGFADDADERRVRGLERDLGAALPSGYVSEIGPQREAWVGSAAACLARGALLLLDYGYPRRELYHHDRREGTLRCHYQHRSHDDPLTLVGLQDVTAHVDFSTVAAAGVGAGLDLAGFTTQADFLLASGLLGALEGSDPASPEHVRLTGQIKRLTLPGEMGEAIKVMALARGVDGPLPGFSGRDHRPRL